jgi:hypothetical protein
MPSGPGVPKVVLEAQPGRLQKRQVFFHGPS